MAGNNFIKNLFIVKSNDCIVRLPSKLHTSKAYGTMGKHFCFKASSNFMA